MRGQDRMNNQLSPISWQALTKKSLVWGIWMFFLAIVQTSFFSVFRVFGAVPDLILPAVIAIAVYDRERMGTIAGIMGGYISDAIGGTGLSLSPPVYMMCGCLVALLAYSVLRRDIFSWLVGTFFSLIVTGAVAAVSAYFSVGAVHFDVSDVLVVLILRPLLASLIIGVPVYFSTKAIWSRFFDNREMEG